jgi:hypothetical protein
MIVAPTSFAFLPVLLDHLQRVPQLGGRHKATRFAKR